MRKVDSKNKACIYLDQFVVSDIMDGINPLWVEIKKLLEYNYNSGKMYCPLCPEHTIETTRKTLDSAIIHDNFIKGISDNYLLKSEPSLTAQIISSLIRNNKTTINTFLIKGEFKELKGYYDDLNHQHDQFNNGITTMLSDQNNLRKNCSSKKIDKHIEIQLAEFITQTEVNKFKERLIEYVEATRIWIRPDTCGELQVPNWIDHLLYQLTYKHRFREKELRLLLMELENFGFSRIPTLHTKFSLKSYLAIKNKQENSGDHIDIMRISSYLFSTDIFFTDKKRKHEILELGLDKKYNTLVLSGVQSDLKHFISILTKL